MLTEYGVLIRSHWPILCFGLLTVFVGNFGQSFFISWYGAEIQRSLNLSATVYGSAYSFATLISGFMIMFTGSLIDRVSLKVFVTGASAGLVFAALLMWQADSLVSLMIAFFLIRFCGQGLLPHTGITAMGRYFSVNRGKAISLVSNGIPLGEIILPATIVIIIGITGWQKSWLIVALFILLVMWPLMFFLLRKADDGTGVFATEPILDKHNAPSNHGSRSTLLHDKHFWRALPLILAPPFIITGLFIHQGFILQDKGWSSAVFASAFVVYGISHWFSSMITGWMVDKFSATKLLSLIGLPFIVGLLLGAWTEFEWASFLLLGCLGIGVGTMGPIVNSLWAEVYGITHLGSIRSFTSSLMIFSTAISPALFGFLIDQKMTANMLLLSMALYTTFASVLVWFSYRIAKPK